MKISTKRQLAIIGGSLLICFLIFRFSGCEIRKSEDNRIKHDTLASIVKQTEKVLDSKLAIKTLTDEKSIKVNDSITKLIKTLTAQIVVYRNVIKSNKENTRKIPDSILHYKLDSIEDNYSVELFADYLSSNAKDSLIVKQDSVIKANGVLISRDSIDKEVCNDALNACLSANKAKKDLIVDLQPKHPYLAKFVKFVEPVTKPIKIAGAAIITALSVKGGYDLWYKK